MAMDLTGGLDPSREHVFAERPDNPEMRDSVSMWISDDRGALGIPRVAIEAVASDWGAHQLQLNVAFPDGRVYRLRESGQSHPALDGDGRATVLGTGPLAFQCLEPFTTWTVTFHGTAVQASTQALIAGSTDGPRVDLAFRVEATMAAPPWIQGALLPEAGERLRATSEGALMGGPRYEQLFQAKGSLCVGGEEHTFAGSGLRIRRQGVRDLTDFRGHCWQSALFPSGRAFGYIAYPPRDDGQPTFNEGFLYQGDGPLIPARVVQAPWLGRLQPTGEDVSVVFESELGKTRIGGETVVSTFDVVDRPSMPNFPVLHQGGARYRWDGEETYGMLERSSARDKITWP
ncbi:hypothetical protein [Streptomyces fuscichromogenes]|uniref:Uncharacterized protein n=1 Tax=Streptomyces fuscichromogenes TaxID=1324013 RepID=A0A918CQ66_9ACTN|nr:hypothetical protein [Streptomyces fuscichromogenes]GGM98460.1 hypothetical protein GCM10011578_019350 [Streptomyces fuscichromogenes]